MKFSLYLNRRVFVMDNGSKSSLGAHVRMYISDVAAHIYEVNPERFICWFKHIYFKVTMIIQTDMTYTQKIGLERKHKLI